MEPELLDQRARDAQAHYRACNLCEHRCGVDRAAGGRGPCRAGTVPRVFGHNVEFGDELEIVPTHAFYLSGCDLRCAFCIAGLDAFDPTRGRPLDAAFFGGAVAWGRARGARNVQWVGGEPTIHLPAILEVMAAAGDLPPIVWKSDFHGTPEAMALLAGVVDTYVADFKFGNDACAKRLAAVEDYVAIVTRNLKLASRQGRLIVRHLLLPGHLDCCVKPIVTWMQAELPGVPLSLRDGYLPHWRARRFAELATPGSRRDVRVAREVAVAGGVELIR